MRTKNLEKMFDGEKDVTLILTCLERDVLGMNRDA